MNVSGESIQDTQRVVPTNGSTVTINGYQGTATVILAPATDLTSLNIVWPSSPVDGFTVYILSTANISGISNSGNALNTPFTSMKSSGVIAFTYDAAGGAFMVIVPSNNNLSTMSFTTTVTSSGNGFVYPTSDGTVNGTPLFSTISSAFAFPTLANPAISCGRPTISPDRKTVTIPSQTLSFTGVTVLSVNVLGSVAPINTANGVSLNLILSGVLA